MLMIIASFENLANTLLYLAYSVAVYEDVQNKLYDELMQTIKKDVSKVYSNSNICSLQFTRLFIELQCDLLRYRVELPVPVIPV